MKKILLFSTILFIAFFVKAQTLELYSLSDVLINNGDTVTVDSMATVPEMLGEVKVKNVAAQAKSVFCEKQEISIVNGTENTFCWGLCFPPTTFVSPDPISIASGEVYSGFSGHYSPKNIPGATVVKYTFKINHGDSAWVFIKYNAIYNYVDLNNISKNISKPFPNPANSNFNINFNLEKENNYLVEIYNSEGQKVFENILNMTKGLNYFNVSDLYSGLYICNIKSDGILLKSEKLIIVH